MKEDDISRAMHESGSVMIAPVDYAHANDCDWDEARDKLREYAESGDIISLRNGQFRVI